MVEVILAGYPIDAELINEVKKAIGLAKEGNNTEALSALAQLSPDMFTPETISAAYARISRDPRPIPELRRDARRDLEATKKSNKEVLFGQGHKAVADGFMFNFDVLGLSRLATEELEARRIGCGYVEKSQRYITLEGDFVLPAEFSPEDAQKLRNLINDVQNRFYFDSLPLLIKYQKSKNPDLVREAEEKTRKGVPNNKNSAKNRYEGLAKEDARYSLSLATQTQIGVSFNARTLEHAIRTMRYSELAEVRELSKKLFDCVKDIAPSLIALADPEIFRAEFGRELIEDNYRETRANLKKIAAESFEWAEKSGKIAIANGKPHLLRYGDATLIGEDGIDINIFASILFANSTRDIEDCYRTAKLIWRDSNKVKQFMRRVFQYISEFDAVPREFEVNSGLIYCVNVSASNFAQLKRHRMDTLLSQDYEPELGYTMPESIRAVGLEGRLREACDASSALFNELKPKYGRAAEYALTNAHRRRALVAINIREAYHFSRMREDIHAQWDIRKLAGDISQLAIENAPFSAMYLGGKHEFSGLKKELDKE